jgi:capsular polysaccharide biosynthesis protein
LGHERTLLVDLLSIFLALWRHKITTLLVIVMTGAGASYVLLARPSTYESSATLLVVAPPRPPTTEERNLNPSLAAVNADNPYARAYDPGLIIDIVATHLNSASARERLSRQGADRDYAVAPKALYGFSSPVAEIRATANTSGHARRTAQLVVEAFQDRLVSIQSNEGVDRRFFIETRIVDPPSPGVLKASGKVRALAALFALALLVLFTLISTFDSIARARAGRRVSKELSADPVADRNRDNGTRKPPSHPDELPTTPQPAPSVSRRTRRLRDRKLRSVADSRATEVERT